MVINSPRLGRRLEFMFSTVLDCRQSLSEFSFWFCSTWLRGNGLGCIALLEVTKLLINFTLRYRKALIPDGQGAIKLERVYCSAHKIFTVFSIYASLQAGRYPIEKTIHFTSAVWLELGLALISGEFTVQARTI